MLAERVHPIWAMEDEDRTFDEIILATIPLPELIAVARAAKKLAQNAEGELLIDTYFNAEGAELLRALQSLMATGKATL